jgi:hypothetical protein
MQMSLGKRHRGGRDGGTGISISKQQKNASEVVE